MTLEELRKAMEAAQAKAKANPTDKQLQKEAAEAQEAYDTAKAAADKDQDPGDPDPDDDGEGKGDDKGDLSKLDDKAKAELIGKLRKENAKHRTKAKDQASKAKADGELLAAVKKALGLTEEEKPEDKIASLEQTKSVAEFQRAIYKTALENGVPADQLDYFEFLITKATSELEEGEELPDESLVEIVTKVKKLGGGKGAANTTVTNKDGKGGQPKPAGDGGGEGEVSLEKFCSMSIVEKSKFYEKNPDLASQYMQEARRKKKLV